MATFLDKLFHKNILLFTSVFLCIFLFAETCHEKKEFKGYIKHMEILRDSLKVEKVKNKYGKKVSQYSRGVFRSRLTDIELESKYADSTLLDFAKTIKNNTQTSTVFVTDTKYKIVEKLIRDTIQKIDTFYQSNNWIDITGVIKSDSINLDLSLKNEYNISHSYYKKDLFRNPELKVFVLSQNPYTEIGQVYSYVIKDYKNALRIMPSASLMLRDTVFLPSVGIDIQYDIKRVQTEFEYDLNSSGHNFEVSLKYKLIQL